MAGSNIDLNTLTQASALWYHIHPTLGMDIDWTCSRTDSSTLETVWNFNVNVYDRPEHRNFGYTMTTYIYVNDQLLGSGVVLYGENYGDTNPPTPFSISNEKVNISSSTAEIKIYSTCTANCNHSEGDIVYWNNGKREDKVSVNIDPYNPHSNPEIQVDNDGVEWSDRRNNRNVRYRYKTDGHNAYIHLASEANSFEVAGSTSWTGWVSRSFNPMGCGQPYDAEYKVGADITDKNDGSYTGHTDGPTLYCYGSLKCSLGTVPASMIKGTTYDIPVKVEPDAFTRDDSHISYGIYIDTNKYTISSDAGSGRTTYNSNYRFTPSNDGTTYTFKAWVKHNVTGEEWVSEEKSSTTYVDPVVGDITGNTLFSPQDTANYTWTNNASELGRYAQQTITIMGSSKNNVVYELTSLSLAPFNNSYWVNRIFDNNARSVDKLSSKLVVTLTNTASGVSASKSLSFNVQYKPVKDVTNISISNSGKTIAIDNVANTTVQWKYPYNDGGAGVVSGFRVRVFSDDSYNNQVGQDYFVVTDYNTYITGPTYSISFNNETQLQRGVMNYVDITPYYTYPQTNEKSYGNVKQAGKLIKPYMYMSKPTIAYPKNNTTWHNKNFRVLFYLKGHDMDYETYSDTIKNSYKYSDLEINVNGTVYAFSGKYTNNTAHPEIFSSDIDKANTNNHRKYMAINPSLILNFPDVNDGSEFRIKIRVQRGNYYFTKQEMQGQDSLGTTVKTWSDWSDEIVLNKSIITPQNLALGDLIMASHYNTVHNWGLRLLACYPLNNKDSGDVDQVRGNQIDGSKTQTAEGSDEYEAVFRTMQKLIAGVNNYCTYDRQAVSFNNTPTFSALEEIITSAESTTIGRNYMNLLTRYMNDYLK